MPFYLKRSNLLSSLTRLAPCLIIGEFIFVSKLEVRDTDSPKSSSEISIGFSFVFDWKDDASMNDVRGVEARRDMFGERPCLDLALSSLILYSC